MQLKGKVQKYKSVLQIFKPVVLLKMEYLWKPDPLFWNYTKRKVLVHSLVSKSLKTADDPFVLYLLIWQLLYFIWKKRRFLQFKLIPPSALLNKIWYNTKWGLSADNYALKCFSDYNCHLVYLYTVFNSECVSCS